MKTSFLCLSLLPLTVSAVSLRLDPDSDQFFSSKTIVLSCEGQRDVWTVKRTTETQTSQSCGGREQDFGKIKGSSCVLEFPEPSDSGSYWCESGSGARGPQRPLSVTGGHLILESPGLPVEAGSDVTLRCRTRPGSGLNSEIHRNRTLIQSRSEWTITDVSKLHEGRYSCFGLKNGAAVRSAERELRVKDRPPNKTVAPPNTTVAPPSTTVTHHNSTVTPPSFLPPYPAEWSVQWVLLRLLVGSPYCVCTVLLVWIYSGQRGTGSPPLVSMETGQEEEEYDDVDAEVTTEHHF